MSVWRKLESDPKTFEVLRNLPLRHPLLWLQRAGLNKELEARDESAP